MAKSLRIEIEAEDRESEELLVAINAEWPRPLEVTINGIPFRTIRYERIDD